MIQGLGASLPPTAGGTLKGSARGDSAFMKILLERPGDLSEGPAGHGTEGPDGALSAGAKAPPTKGADRHGDSSATVQAIPLGIIFPLSRPLPAGGPLGMTGASGTDRTSATSKEATTSRAVGTLKSSRGAGPSGGPSASGLAAPEAGAVPVSGISENVLTPQGSSIPHAAPSAKPTSPVRPGETARRERTDGPAPGQRGDSAAVPGRSAVGAPGTARPASSAASAPRAGSMEPWGSSHMNTGDRATHLSGEGASPLAPVPAGLTAPPPGEGRTGEAASRGALTQQVASAMAERLQNLPTTWGRTVLRVAVTPPHMGPVTVTLTRSAQGVSVALVAASGETSSALSSGREEIRRRVGEALGAEVPVEISVETQGGAAAAGEPEGRGS